MATATEEPSKTAPEEDQQEQPTSLAVVDPEQKARAELDRQQAAEVDAAAEAALAMPGMASRDEFLALAMQAKLLSMSGAAPKAIKGRPHVALHVAMIGRDLGISPSAAVELIDVVGKEGNERPSLSPQLMNGQLRRLGLGSIARALLTDDKCVAVALGPGGGLDDRCKRLSKKLGEWEHVEDDAPGGPCRCHGIVGETEVTWAEAKQADLVDPRCVSALNHWVKPGTLGRDKDNRCYCAQGWRTYPRRMLWWRASGFAADDWFPEAGLGLYTAEELGAVVDTEGRLIDPATVELPEGYEAGGGTGGTVDEPVDPADAWNLQLRVFAMPEDAQAEFRQRWVQQKVAGSLADDPGHEPPRRRFAAAKLNLVSAMLRGVEQQWKAQRKYDPETGPAAFAENVLGPSVLHWLALPYGGISFRATPPDPDAAKTAASTPQAAPAAPEPGTAADTATGQDGPAGAVEAAVEPQPDGALPLALPEPAAADPTDALLVIPDEVRAGTVDERADWVIGHVKAMSLGLVDELLRRRYEADDKGTPNQRRARLAELVSIHELGEDPAGGAGPR